MHTDFGHVPSKRGIVAVKLILRSANGHGGKTAFLKEKIL